MSLAQQLESGISALGIHVAPDTRQKLLDFLDLIEKWNRVHNLTAVRDKQEMVGAHLLDSLAIAPHLEALTALDVGSGAGLPGVPLALIWPKAHVTLIDSSHKKASFLRQAAIELGLKNVEVINERVETWNSSCQFDLVISRAFSDLAEFVRLAGRHCTLQGTLAAMKGVYPHEELTQLPDDFTLKNSVALNVPGLRAERHLVLLARRT